MAIRRRTVVLLFALAGVALLGVVHRRPRVWVYDRVESHPAALDYYEPTPAQSAAMFAQLTAPKGFRRTSVECDKNEACFHNPSSMILSETLVDRWASEAGLAVDRKYPAVLCVRHPHIRPGHIRLMGCGGISATRGKSEVDVFAHSLVLGGPHGIRPTNARFKKLQGTELHLIDFGVPDLKAIRDQEAEFAKERARVAKESGK